MKNQKALSIYHVLVINDKTIAATNNKHFEKKYFVNPNYRRIYKYLTESCEGSIEIIYGIQFLAEIITSFYESK